MTKKIIISSAIVSFAIAASCAGRAANNENSSSSAAEPYAGPNGKTPVEPRPTPTPETVVQINKDPATLAKAFYEFYLDGTPNMEGNEVTFLQYLTPRFYAEAERIETYDPFLDTQEADPTWKDHIKISDVVITGGKATLTVLLDGRKEKWKAKLALVKKAGTWKIDGIDMSVR